MNFQKGIKLALLTAVFSGFAIFFNGFVVRKVGDPLVFTTLKNLGVALIIGVILSVKTIHKKISFNKLTRREWWLLALIGIIGGSVPFYLFFKGLSIAASAKAAFIHKSLIFWVAFWAVPVLKEKITTKQLLALFLVFGSNFVIGGLGEVSWGTGEWMILAATVLWGVENIIAKITLKKVQADVVVGARMIFGSLLLLAATVTTGKMGLIFKLDAAQWGLTLVTVVFLTGYVISWYNALKVASATLVSTVLTLGAVITNILSAIFITHSLKVGHFYQMVLLVAGVWFFSTTAKKIYVDFKHMDLGLS